MTQRAANAALVYGKELLPVDHEAVLSSGEDRWSVRTTSCRPSRAIERCLPVRGPGHTAVRETPACCV